MRAFIVACLVATVIALAAAAVLVDVAQETSASAFTESSARIN